MTQMEVALVCSTTALWIWIWMLERRLSEYLALLEKEVEELQKLRKQLEKK